ncbi:hypothetical protein LWI28_001102 [Acer negundo]|uniref:Dirigent protein n=1 Tax=Acer negundo TaxID=4023 RepID=A0AAD5IWW1_ACENE|nr:hypothetical protein LWI28_001102 [Acer negundo]
MTNFGKNPSAVRVAQASEMTDKSPTFFGMVMMADDPLTETPDPKSKLVGRAQGLYGSASQAELGLIMVFNYASLKVVQRICNSSYWLDPASGDAIVGYNVTIVH